MYYSIMVCSNKSALQSERGGSMNNPCFDVDDNKRETKYQKEKMVGAGAMIKVIYVYSFRGFRIPTFLR